MPTSITSGLNIIGTYPIVNKQISSINDDGVETISYAFTIKTSDTNKYVPTKDDEYYGPSASASTAYAIEFSPSPNADASKYLVTSVDVQNLNGGLTQIIVHTAGTRNIETPPKIRLLPNYPLLFGLSGTTQNTNSDPNNIYNWIGAGRSRAGLGVMMTFVTANTIEGESFVYSSLSNKLMPRAFRGTLLPAPAKEPFRHDSRNTNNSLSWIVSNYKGFVCAETTYQKIGGAIVFQLIYREMGNAYSVNCPPEGGVCITTTIYNFD
jgi:hypothetical protein